MKPAKKKKKSVGVRWAKWRQGRGTDYSIWIGNAIVGWEGSEASAIARVEAANAELSRLVAARDRRMK